VTISEIGERAQAQSALQFAQRAETMREIEMGLLTTLMWWA